MKRLTSALLTAVLMSATGGPAFAGHGKGGAPAPGQAAPPQAAPPQAAPAQPKHAERAVPAQVERAIPAHLERAIPARVERAIPAQVQRAVPSHIERAVTPRVERAVPSHVEHAVPSHVERAVPAHIERAITPRAERGIPAQIEHAIPSRMQHAITPHGARAVPGRLDVPNFGKNIPAKPFVKWNWTRTSERDVQAVRASERLVTAPVYHPAFVSGKVAAIVNNQIVLTTPAGEEVNVFVRGWHGKHKGWLNRVLSVPVVFENGVYFTTMPAIAEVIDTQSLAYVPQYGYVADYGYVPNYGYVPDYAYAADYGYAPGYAYVPDSSYIANYAMANTLTSLLSSVLGNSNGGSIGHSLLQNFLASYLVGAIAGNTPYYAQPFAPMTQVLGASYAPSYITPAYTTAYPPPAMAVTPLTYAYPMTCVYNDPATGAAYYDPSCAPAATTTYYTSPTAYAPAQLQGVVVATSGSSLMVLGANGLQPVLVDASPAFQMGYALNGRPSAGRVVDAYGFYSGSTFVATTLL